MSLDDARDRLADVRAKELSARAAVRAAERELRLRTRAFGTADARTKQAEAEHARRLAALRRLRGETRGVRTSIAEGVAEWLGSRPTDEVARLDAAYPIVLLPVRLETIFDLQTPELRVRVYPDAISADMFDAALTETERSRGQEYWRRGWDPEKERDAWRALVSTVRPARAAWIVQALEPTNLSQRPEGEPVFPAVETRPDTWSRAAETRLLPDRWIVLAYRDGVEVGRVVGPPIREPLALTLAPDAEPEDLVELSDGIEVDAEFLWTLDFGRAEEAGMALRMPLGPADVERGFDRLLVTGVKGSLEPAKAGASLEALFDGHHYSRGLALLRQGTPTNNTGIAPAGYPPPSDPDVSFAVEREAPLTAEGTDGTLLAAALGVAPEVMAHVDGAGRFEQRAAAAMNDALWPATLGYTVEQMYAPAIGPDTTTRLRQHFTAYVRGRGALPALRAGSTPYGILPASSMKRWVPRSDSGGIDVTLPALAAKAHDVWLQLAAGAPRVGRTDDPDADLLAVLGMDASAREVRLREVIGLVLWISLGQLLDVPELATPVVDPTPLQALGLAGIDMRVLHVLFVQNAFRYRFSLVTREALSEETPLTDNYIRFIRQASIVDLITFLGDAPDRPLLARMLRHGALTTYARIAVDIEITHGLATIEDIREPELVRIVPGTEQRPTPMSRFGHVIPEVTGTLTLGEFLTGTSAPISAQEYRAALQTLEDLPTAELQRLFTETLDACAFRLDAWISSLAAKRLAEMRGAQPRGCHIGAYGWVEGLRPRDRSAPAGGHIHSPSMAHAAAAAVLRNAHLTHRGEAQERVTLDLSSARVRMALRLLDGVRQGQPVGALLGYRFERTLHERALDVYIERFRKRFPLATDPATTPEQPSQGVAARNVVDGLALRTAFREGRIPFGEPGSELPGSGAEFDGIVAALRILDDEVDATADLLLAESVYQAVQGQVDSASAALSTVTGDARAPEPEIVRSPRGGISITHRLALALGDPPPLPSGWPSTPTPRAEAEPRLDAWFAVLLGNPATVRCRVSVPDPTPPDPAHRTERVVTLSDLQLRPTDAVGLGPSELEARVAWAVRAVPRAAEATLIFEADPAWDRAVIRTFPEVLELASAIRALVATARQLEAGDLVKPGEQPPPADPAELAARVVRARARLASALTTLENAAGHVEATPGAPLDPLRVALLDVSLLGVPEAVPRSILGSGDQARESLLEQAPAVIESLRRRIEALDAAAAPADALRAAFGQTFVALPLVTVPQAAELARAIAHGPALVGDARAPHKWFQRAARVRPGLARLRAVGLVAEPLGAPAAALEVAQLPHADDARWAALPFEGDARPVSGTLSLALRRSFGATTDVPWSGLLVDEWVELIPSPVQSTGIAVHYDEPGAEAPQAVLIAVPPDPTRWNLESLVAVLHETMDLAKIRAVDTELLGDLARLLPATYLASNIADDTVSTRFHDFVIAEPVVLAES